MQNGTWVTDSSSSYSEIRIFEVSFCNSLDTENHSKINK